MVYYPLSTLMLAEFRDILLISTPQDIGNFEKLLETVSIWELDSHMQCRISQRSCAIIYYCGIVYRTR